MAAEIVVLIEIIDLMPQLTRNYFSLLLDYEEDGEFHLISATLAFMKRDHALMRDDVAISLVTSKRGLVVMVSREY